MLTEIQTSGPYTEYAYAPTIDDQILAQALPEMPVMDACGNCANAMQNGRLLLCRKFRSLEYGVTTLKAVLPGGYCAAYESTCPF